MRPALYPVLFRRPLRGGPDLDLNFAASGTLDPRVTYTGASLATLTDATGAIAYKPHNLFTNSADFSQASWVKGGASVSGTGALVEDGTTGVHRIYQSASTSENPSMCVRAMAGTRSWMMLQDIGGAKKCWFDLTNGVVGTKSSGVTGSITAVGGGYYDCTITIDATSSIYLIEAASADNSTTYTGVNGNTAITLARAQLNAGPLQPYYPTTSAAYYGPRFTYDPVTHAALGLLVEEQRTNLLLQSNSFGTTWIASSASATQNLVGPDGGTTGWTATDSNGAVTGEIYLQSINTTPAASYTYSMYVAKTSAATVFPGMYVTNAGIVGLVTIDTNTGDVTPWTAYTGLTILTCTATSESFNSLWWRIKMTFSAPTASLLVSFVPALTTNSSQSTGVSNVAAQGSAGIFGGQFEAGAFATTYIPTTSASVTRAADSATMTGSNFSSWFNATQGTFVPETRRASATVYGGIMATDNGGVYSGGAGMLVRFNNAGSVEAGGNSSAVSRTGLNAVGSLDKVAYNYSVGGSNPMNISANGGAVGNLATTDYTGIGVARLIIGGGPNGALNAPISRLRYYPVALTNAQLQALTT